MLTAIGFFVWLFGLCVGSFLNVVLYRLPAGLSIARPARSFCPGCKASIAWYDNVPLLSWLLLRGRCRRCGVAISPQYPLVEAATGLCFVLVYYLLFVQQARHGAAPIRFPEDAPLLLSWLLLAAVMVACASMDLVSYMVDTRITDAAVIGGLVCHAAWPRAEFLAPEAGGASGAAGLVVLIASGVALWLTARRSQPEADDEPAPAAPAAEVAANGRRGFGAAVVGMLLFAAISVWLLSASAAVPGLVGAARSPFRDLAVPAGILALFAAVVLVSGQRREADHDIAQAIEEEQPRARRIALLEALWLAPLVAVGLLVYAIVAQLPAVADSWQAAANWSPGGGFVPVAGLAYAAHGAIVGAAAGWILRVVFTLLFGREALGTGDIYILAAAGAAAGWDIALLGLLLAVGLAMAGWLLTLLLRSSVILSFGPWLALGFVAALWLNEPAADIASQYKRSVLLTWREQPSMLLMAGGVMIVGTGVAVLLARLVRRVAERQS